jgi:hypothetical protein
MNNPKTIHAAPMIILTVITSFKISQANKIATTALPLSISAMVETSPNFNAL